jgi:hypothetical protein
MITAFNHDSHAYANSSPMEHIMQLAYETVKYATGFVNDITPRGFADIHYDVEVSDLTEGNPQTEAFIGGQTRSVAGQEANDLFNGNVIGVIKDAEIIYNEERFNTDNVLTDTISIFANNLLTGKKLTSNILVPVTGVVEKVGGEYLGKLLGVNEQGDFTGTGFANIISSGGKSIGRNFGSPNDTTQNDIGNATKRPRKDGTISNPNRISDANQAIRRLNGAKF